MHMFKKIFSKKENKSDKTNSADMTDLNYAAFSNETERLINPTTNSNFDSQVISEQEYGNNYDNYQNSYYNNSNEETVLLNGDSSNGETVLLKESPSYGETVLLNSDSGFDETVSLSNISNRTINTENNDSKSLLFDNFFLISPLSGKTININKQIFTIGSDKNSDYMICKSSVSNNHASILIKSIDEFYIVDNDSTNGSQVEGVSIEPMKLFPIENGDLITFGEEIYQFYIKNE